MSDNPPVSPPSYKTDSTYYWDIVTFLVEDTLFRVPKYNFLAQSETFASLYGISRDGSNTLGSVSVSDYTPVDLVKLDVAISDFRAFLKVLYPMVPYSKSELEASPSKNAAPKPSLSEAEWISILKLSTHWRFNEIRAMAIDALTSDSKMDHIAKANLAKEYSVEQWLLSAYGDLVQRHDPITIEEAERLGWRNAITLFQIREGKFTSLKRSAPALMDKILEHFPEDFKRIREAQLQHMTAAQRAASSQPKDALFFWGTPGSATLSQSTAFGKPRSAPSYFALPDGQPKGTPASPSFFATPPKGT